MYLVIIMWLPLFLELVRQKGLPYVQTYKLANSKPFLMDQIKGNRHKLKPGQKSNKFKSGGAGPLVYIDSSFRHHQQLYLEYIRQLITTWIDYFIFQIGTAIVMLNSANNSVSETTYQASDILTISIIGQKGTINLKNEVCFVLSQIQIIQVILRMPSWRIVLIHLIIKLYIRFH